MNNQPFLLHRNGKCLEELGKADYEMQFGIRDVRVKVFRPTSKADDDFDPVDAINDLLDPNGLLAEDRYRHRICTRTLDRRKQIKELQSNYYNLSQSATNTDWDRLRAYFLTTMYVFYSPT